MASFNRLVLFEGINPNTKGNIYYVFDYPVNFYDSVLASHKVAIIDEPNYRINNGQAIISTEGTISSGITSFTRLQGITYIADRRTDTLDGGYYWTFYHVNKIYFQAGKCYMDVALDDFANGMQKATMSNIRVSRVSRGNLDALFQVSRLTYDGPFMPYGNYQYEDTTSDIGYGVLIAVAKIDMVVSTDGFANNAITRSAYFCFDVRDIIGKYNSMDKTPCDWLTKVQDMLGGIHEGFTFSAESGQAQQMKCSAIYVVPSTYLPAIKGVELGSSSYCNINVSTKSGLTGYEGSIYGHSVIPSHYEYQQGYELGRDAMKAVPFFGTRGQWMQLPRKYKTGDIAIVCDASTGGLQIKAKQGSNEVDMTNAFVLPCSFSNDIDTENTQVQKGIINALSIVQSVLKAGKKGDGIGAGIGTWKSIAELMNNNNAKSNSTDGNAFMTYCPKMGSSETQDEYFERIQNKSINNPFIMAYVTDMNDGDAYVRNYGVATDDAYSDKSFLSTIASYEYLGDVNVTAPSDTFVQCTMAVQGVPEQNRKAIEDAFKDGIRYIYVKSSS